MSTVVREPMSPARRRRRDVVGGVLAVTAVALLTFGATRLVESPEFVDRITIRNPTDAFVDISAAGRTGSGATPVTIVEPRSTTVIEEVLDHGDEWVFRYEVSGERAGSTRVSRQALEQAGWRIVVPETSAAP